MSRKTRRYLSLLMVLAMVFTLIPAGGGITRALADDAKTVIDVWDFGAEALTDDTGAIEYNNHVTVDMLKGYFGTDGKNTAAVMDFGGGLVWNGKTGHRLYSSTADLSGNIAGTGNLPSGMAGKLNLNTASSDKLYFALTGAKAGDKLTVWCDGDGSSGGDNTLVLAKEDDPTKMLQPTSVAQDKNTETEVNFYIPADGDYRVWMNIAKKGNYSRLTLERAVTKTVTGSVTGLGDGTGSVEFTHAKSGVKYSGEVQADGSYSIKLPAITEEVAYTVSFSDTSFAIASGGENFVLSRATTELTRDIAFSAVTTCEVTGSISGFEAGADLTNAELSFVTEAESTFEPTVVWDKAAMTYTATLEKEVSYTAVITGANDYAVATATFTAAAGTQDIAVAKKPVYPVALQLGAGSELSGKAVSYVFTHEDGYQYTFNDISAVALRDGTYTVSMEGDFEKLPWKMDAGTSLTVNGEAVSGHVITFAPVTSWSFTSNGYGNRSFEGNEGFYQGLHIDAASGKLTGRGSDAQFNTGAVIHVPVDGKCSITVNVNGGGQYALYTVNGVQADTGGTSWTYEYDGPEGAAEIVSTGTTYLTGITVVYPAKEVEFVPQTAMPYVPENDTDAAATADTDGNPRGNKKDSLVVQPEGQKLVLTQSGGVFAQKFADVKDTGYYLFPMTGDSNKLEFDLIVTAAGGTTNYDGFFGGIFTNNYIYTLGLRGGGQKIRGIYTKNGGLSGGEFAGAGSPTEENIGLNRPVHYTIEMDGGKPKSTITFVDDTGATQTRSWSQGFQTEPDGAVPTQWYYGFGMANVSAVITNMVYTGADGTVLYSQNDCYYPEGSMPEVTAGSVTAQAAGSREYIDVSWSGSVPEGDGTYIVEMKKDGGEWVELADDVAEFTYRYIIPEGEGGAYLFRVCGQLGQKNLGGTRNSYVEMAAAVSVQGALAKPVVTAVGNAAGITLTWPVTEGAEFYLIYRYSFDEGADAVSVLTDVTAATYTDTAVTAEVPYYYTVKAVSASNESPVSDVVWAVATAGHSGAYVYEDEAAEISLTKKSYDTVFDGKAVLEGVVLGNGKLAAELNGTKAAEKEMTSGDSFSFELTLTEGRNDVNLLFTDGNGKVTRKTYNFVYLTNYDMIADAAYAGTDGGGDVPTYKTVQAAVDAAPAEGAVILVLAGSYEERLVVDKPNITIIGEDRESTSIHFYPGKLGGNYEAGGDMDKRCAAYIMSGATNFHAENISFANDYVYSTADGKSNKSADAIRVEAANSAFVNVKFTGVQDTLYMHSGTQYYDKCRIEGLVDFIYSGDAARSYFNDCEIVFVYESTKTSGYVCAPKTAAAADYGLTFNNCVIVGEEGCSGSGYLLARPWGPDAYITWINCYMGKVINKTEPYGAMSGNQHQDARFFEYGTYGPGFVINPDRRQISPAAAANMIKADYLGWDPEAVSAQRAASNYVGTKITDRGPNYVETEFSTDKYQWTDGNDTGLKAYDMEGYAAGYGVSGGGLLKETSGNYYKAATAAEFLDALTAIKASGKNSVIELTADINLGCNEIENFANYSSIIKAYSAQPLTHPTLIKTGVSVLSIQNMYNLTIFSSNGSSIKHANITMKNSENIIIRNIKFDELWEWDEVTEGDYDRNDWDYMTIDSGCNGIWIDHCTFYKAYDGIVDVKNPAPTDNVTISWCEFLPGSEDDIFFDVMMNDIFANPDKYPTYKHMAQEGMSNEQVRMYAYGQKKTHLFGQDDTAVNAAGIQVTLANNYYKNSMDRMPRLRYGYSHVYNCIMDAQDLLDARRTIANEDLAKKIVSNGAASTCEAQVLLENCYINGIQNALNSGNGSSPSGYINAINSVYYMDGVLTELAPKCNTTGDTRVLITNADSFIAGLPYTNYHLYDAEKLDRIIIPHAGAGKLNLTNLQWEKVSYNAEWKDIEVPKEEEPEKPTEKPTETPTEPSTEEPTETPAEPSTQEPTQPSAEDTSKEPEGIVIKVDQSAQNQDESRKLIANAVVVSDNVQAQVVFKNEAGQTVGTNTVRLVVDTDEKASVQAQKVLEEAVKNSGVEVPQTAEIVYMELFLVDDSGNKLTMENGRLRLVFDYPDGTNKDSYDFTIIHGLSDGNAEVLKPTLTDAGIVVEVDSLSPFALVYTERAQSPSTGNGFNPFAYLLVLGALALAGASAMLIRARRKEEEGK